LSAAASTHPASGPSLTGEHTTGSLAALLGAELIGPAHLTIDHLETVDRAGPGALTFIRNGAFAAEWASSRATAALVSRGVDVPGHDASARALLVVPDADLALITVLELFAPAKAPVEPGVHSSAVVDPSASISPGASVGPCCVVHAGAVVEHGAVLVSGVTIGAESRVGRGTVLHPGAVVGDRCRVGEHCILHAGVVLGADGFGYRPAPVGAGVVKIPHIGIVELGNHVEIGANSCIDRAKFGATVIGDGTKIDNLVQIAHNCRIGRGCLICGKCGLSGSVTLGDGVILAGGVHVADNLSLGAGARVAANGGVINDIPAGETWLGLPAMPAGEGTRNYAAFRKLAELARTVRKLEKRLADGSA
jgi:UDP-3-O-[3-hydroxymyristoyl] glucosamine N-acyltransferase